MSAPRLIHCPHLAEIWIGRSDRFPLGPRVVPENEAKPGDIIGMSFEVVTTSPWIGRPMLNAMGDNGEIVRVLPFEVDDPLLMQACFALHADPAFTACVRSLVMRFKEDSEDRWRLEVSPQSLLFMRSETQQIASLIQEEAELHNMSIDDVPIDAGLVSQVACLVVPPGRSAHRRLQDSSALTYQVRRLERRLSLIFDEKVLLNAQPVLNA